MSCGSWTQSKTHSGGFNNGTVVKSDSLDIDERCRITITAIPSMNRIVFHEQTEITIYQLVQVYKVKHLKQQLVNGLSQFKCVLDDLPEPSYRVISATVHGKRREKLKEDIIQLLNTFSWYCEECTITRKSFKILKESGFLFTVIRDRNSEIYIVYCKDDSIEWSVDLEGCSEKQKLGLMALLDDVDQTKCMLNGNEITIFTSPRNTDLILDICHNFDNGGYTMIYRGTSNESHISTNICDGKDTLHSNDSEDQPNLSSNTEPGDGHANTNSKRQPPSSLKTEPEDMTMHNDTDVTGTTIPEASGGAGKGSEDFVFLDHPENGEEKSFGSNSDQEKDMDDDTNKDDKNRLSSTSSVTPNYLNTGGDELKRIDSIYSTLFAKRKLILDKILHCFSQSGYNKRLCFIEDGSIEPPLNNHEFFALYVAIRKYLNIKKMLTTRYDLPDGWVDSVNIIEQNIVVEKRESHIVIVGLKYIVDRVLVNLRQYRKEGVSTEDFQQIETNIAAESTEYLDLYSYGISRPVDCEYICKAGDQLLYELQQRYRCFIDIQPLVTGTKEIHFANWIYDSKEVDHIEIPLIIGNYRELPQQSDMLVLTQNHTDQCYLYKESINECMTRFKCEAGQADYMNFQKMTDSSNLKNLVKALEASIKGHKYKTLILLMDKTTEKETVSVFLKACKSLTKKIYLPMESIPQINRHLFMKGEFEYGGQGHYIEMTIGQIKHQKVDAIVDVVENMSLSKAYDIKVKERNCQDEVLQYSFELNVQPRSFDSSNPIIRLSFLMIVCLREATEKRLASIAFPVLCVGRLDSYPVKLVARTMLDTIDEYFRYQSKTSLCRVMIVIEDGDTSSKEAFFRENIARIKEERMTGDTVYIVDIKITGDKREQSKIRREIDDFITKKEVAIFNPVRERDRVQEVNKTTNRDKAERITTESGIKDRKIPKRKEPVINESRTKSEEIKQTIVEHALLEREDTHESRCVIVHFCQRDVATAHIKNILLPRLTEKNKPLCVVTPFQNDSNKVFMAFSCKQVKDEACKQLQRIFKTFEFQDILPDMVNPVIAKVNFKKAGVNLKKELEDASGVFTISSFDEIFIEGCQLQIDLANAMLKQKYGSKSNKNTKTQPVQVEHCSVKTYKFRALEYLFGRDKMKEICRYVKETDRETHFTLPKDSKNKLVEDLKDLMYRTIRHEEIDVTDDKIEEAKRYSRNHAHMDTVYVEFNIKTSSIHVLGEDYEDVEFVSHQAKVAVGIIKLTNKKQQRTRTDEYTPTPPPVKLALSEIQERIFCTKCKNLTVHVKKSDITILDVDVIVNAANGMMVHGGGVARFIATAGGDELDRQCRRYIDDNGQLPVTGICKTTGGNMRCKQVYHAVGPCWSDYSNKSDCGDDLCKTIVRCLVEADQDGFESIAIPSISSAIFGVPKNICAHMYAKAVKSFDAVHPVSNLREIYFVDVLDGMVSMVQTGFDMFVTQGNDDDLIKEEIARFIKEVTCKGAEQQSEGGITDNKPPEFSMIAVTKEVDNKPYITCSLQSIITLHIYQAAALSTKTDSITTWEDIAMTDFKASVKTIINEAGDGYKEERSKVKSEGGFKAGSVLRTSAGCLQYQNIYHLISTIKPGRIELDVLLDNLVKENSMTTDASITIDIGDVDADALFTSLVNMFKTAKPSTLKEIHLVAESDDKIKKLQSNYGDYIKQLGGIVKTSDTNCSICLDEITDIKALPCGHTFCAECVDEAIEKNPVCPICRSNAYGEIQTGNQPDGKMAHSILHTHLEGFPHRDTIEIVYTFPDGIQSANHPRPGYPYKGKTETAYLPDNMKGREILKLLKLAFDRRLIFTVSPDVTSSSGREFVTWNNIPHKTRKDGGPESNGYPDPDYLPQVKRALYTRGVEIERQDATGEVDRIGEYFAQNRQISNPKRAVLFPGNPIWKENFRDGDELIEVLQRYQNIEITVKTELLIKLSGTIINHDDLVLSLNVKEWLQDTIIDAYLSLLSEDEKQHGNNIYVIPTYIAKLMLSEQYDQCMSSLENVKLDEYTWVFIPVNTHNHWVLLAANIKQGRVSLLDSLHDGNTDVVLKWSKFMNYRGEKTGELNIDWVECNDWVSSKQRDLASCGPFVLLNALAISRNIKPQCFNNEHAKLMRKLVYHRITETMVAGHC